MKKHLLPVVALLLLSSCTEVEEFGAYWDKEALDPRVEGTWKKIGMPGQELRNVPGPDKLVFVKDGPSYVLQMVNPIDEKVSDEVAGQRKKDAEFRVELRTLKIGRHQFFLARTGERKPHGFIFRYEIEGNILREYSLDEWTAAEWVEAKHPDGKNIHRDGRYLVIKTFDDQVFRIFSEISNADPFWMVVCEYKKAL